MWREGSYLVIQLSLCIATLLRRAGDDMEVGVDDDRVVCSQQFLNLDTL